jgi:hypothetical protein
MQTATVEPVFTPQTLDAFCTRAFPEKTPLIEHVLNRRDQISLTGRRRHGKTTLLSNIAIAGACGDPDYLGFRIPAPFTTVAFFLEDDGGELQTKLAKMKNGRDASRFHVYIREDFRNWGINISVKSIPFRERVMAACQSAKPDLVIFDNLGMLIGANYNDPEEVHELMEFTFGLTQTFNCAVLIAAHPRKGGGADAGELDLEAHPEEFFEATMGSSHFINSTGSLWGIQRKKEETLVLLGSQRVGGDGWVTHVEKTDSDWLELSADQTAAAYKHLVSNSTEKRRSAWKELEKLSQNFSWEQAREATKSSFSAQSSFSAWFREILRTGLVEDSGEKRYRVAYKPPKKGTG